MANKSQTNPRSFNDIATEVDLIYASMSEKLSIMKEFLRGANDYCLDSTTKYHSKKCNILKSRY